MKRQLKWIQELFDLRFSTGEQRAQSQGKLIQLAGLVVVIACLIWIPYRLFDGSSNEQIRLAGNNVAELEVGAAVMMQGIQVGQVASVGLDDGEAVAMLQINRQYADQLPTGSRFEIGSGNLLLPGNVVVQVIASDSVNTAAQPPDTDDGIRRELASDRVLPTRTPLGMFIVIGAALLAAAIFLGVVLNIARAAWFWKTIIGVTLAALIYFVATGRLSMDTIKDQVDQIEATREQR